MKKFTFQPIPVDNFLVTGGNWPPSETAVTADKKAQEDLDKLWEILRGSSIMWERVTDTHYEVQLEDGTQFRIVQDVAEVCFDVAFKPRDPWLLSIKQANEDDWTLLRKLSNAQGFGNWCFHAVFSIPNPAK